MSDSYGGINSPAAVEEWGDEYGRHPVGAGPFMFEDWLPGSQITLVRNPDFTAAEGDPLPEHWTAIEPDWQPAKCRVRLTPEGLAFDAPGRPYAVGGVSQEVEGIEGGRAYAVAATCRIGSAASESPMPAVNVRVRWTRDGKPLHPAGVLAEGPFPGDR